MAPTDKLRDLAANPPIRDRLTWRGLLQPGARDVDDRAVMATAFGALYALGGAIGLIAVLVGDPTITDRGLMALGCIVALLIGAVCLVGYRRLPRRFFHVAASTGIGVVTVAALASKGGAGAIYAPFYAFVVMLCMLLFRPRPALLQGLFALVAFGTVLYARETPFATHLLLSSIAMLGSLGALIAVMRTRTRRIAGELSVDAYIDALTAVPNRRSFDERFTLEVERAHRHGDEIALAICDLDRFKDVNDQLGHEEGDRVLRQVAATIGSNIRALDLGARIGGEEFGILMPGTGAAEAAVAAERIRVAIADEFRGGSPSLTISCGVAAAKGGDADHHRLFTRADQALYAAKRAGRNCTVVDDGERRVVGGGSALGRLRESLRAG